MGVLGFIGKGVKDIAAGKGKSNLGIQSPQLPSAIVRVGRFAYITTSAWVMFSWYTGYINQRVEMTESWATKFIPPGATKPVISTPDRPDRSLSSVFGDFTSSTSTGILGPAGEVGQQVLEDGAKALGIANVGKVNTAGRKLIALTPEQLGVPGSAMPGYLWSAPNSEKQMPPYNANRYRELLGVATKIASQFGLKITSGYRPGSAGAGGQLDMHSVGLAFDMVGSENNERRAAKWASTNPGLFQEIFIHNEGSGIHLHLAFYPDAAQILNSKAAVYAKATATQTRAV